MLLVFHAQSELIKDKKRITDATMDKCCVVEIRFYDDADQTLKIQQECVCTKNGKL